MRTLVRDGKTYTLVCARFRCPWCTTMAESTVNHPRDFASCVCGAVTIDGGIGLGATLNAPDLTDVLDLSLYRADDGTVITKLGGS